MANNIQQLYQMHLVNDKGYVVLSTQDKTTIGKIRLRGSHLKDFFDYPAEAENFLSILRSSLTERKPRYYSYFIGGINFISLIFQSLVQHIAEVHEVQINNWNDRLRAINWLENKCLELWHIDCGFRAVAE